MSSLTRKIAVLAALALTLACLTAAAPNSAASGGSLAAKSKAKGKSCKKAKRHCKKKRPPNPYVEGQPCAPAQAKAYARYDYLCLPQPQPDGTTQYQLVKSLA